MQIQVTITGDKELLRGLKKLGQELYMLKSAMEDIGKDLSDYYSNEAFASQGGVFGTPWPRLSSKYASRKARIYAGRSPLIASGKMKESFDYKADNTSVYISNTAKQFKYHQSSAPRLKLPRRAMIGKNRAIVDIVETIVKQEVTRKIKKAGL